MPPVLLVTFSMLGMVLLVLVVLVGFIRRWQLSLKRLFVLATLFGLLMLPWVEVGRVAATMPQPVPLPLDGRNRWVTPPLARAEYWITLSYERKEPRRLPGTLMLRLFDETADNLVLATVPNQYPYRVSGSEESIVSCMFQAVEGHCYRIEVDEDQAQQLARLRCRLVVSLSPHGYMGRLGLP